MFISETNVEVRYAETDQMGIVHHSNYVIWFELGRTRLIKEIGFNYAQMESEGILSPVMDIQVSYKHPATYGEEVTVKTWVERYDGIRVVYGYEIINEAGQTCVTGESTHCCVKKDSFRPISIKRQLPVWHEAYEKIKKS
ncbi:thioesterase family protein [Alkalihalophilus lindianensis]|uniref:Thioesterase family protein n=1 Tax=Alkalihalophilus lindianensis TaxID=1630542 RepID=A0ABU3X7X3_9BACI|nr:thioesterase family protein [Alkalihalophilus lindianensis]MDV2683923.1 thioesterase family protein [Alkalihalophilus lindianensis]